MPGTDEIKTLSQRSLEIALSQNGVQEMPKGSNKGPDVEKYLKSVGLGGGYAWCMSFVYWCVQQAATEMGNKKPIGENRRCDGAVEFHYMQKGAEDRQCTTRRHFHYAIWTWHRPHRICNEGGK
jgi:hypothetical protein